MLGNGVVGASETRANRVKKVVVSPFPLFWFRASMYIGVSDHNSDQPEVRTLGPLKTRPLL
jgi:hypothetical protein